VTNQLVAVPFKMDNRNNLAIPSYLKRPVTPEAAVHFVLLILPCVRENLVVIEAVFLNADRHVGCCHSLRDTAHHHLPLRLFCQLAFQAPLVTFAFNLGLPALPCAAFVIEPYGLTLDNKRPCFSGVTPSPYALAHYWPSALCLHTRQSKSGT
jgi:hypothetical protein